MNDYSTLAERLRCSGHAEKKLSRNPVGQEIDPGAFFEEVKAHIVKEIERANAELHKRRLAPIERVLVPSYLGKLCLTFGTALMCCVDLDAAQGQINSVIFGPPNRWVLSRKEYPLIWKQTGEQNRDQSREDTHRHDALLHRPDRNSMAHGPGAVASYIVSEILETGIRLAERRTTQVYSMEAASTLDEPHFAELWISLGSLLRSYTALYGSNGNRPPEIESGDQAITVRQDEKWLILKRDHAIVTWTRENGMNGAMEFTDHGTLRSDWADQAMDLVAEQWARELMHREPLVHIGN
jgi:hypothetical protein